ncbi:unnamed protein product [Moneuplotes crassus]|uniref:sphinganine-1-phosphate aldolase n=1 Tax=Euplotes crassus TaxID=5936 RepID=A0AAD1U928_EUPCR|nr:unnamed protein product [Moneuplotes crassus]
MWDLDINNTAYQEFPERFIAHYTSLAETTDKFLSERVSKLTLILIPVFLFLVFKYVIPKIKEIVVGNSIITIVLNILKMIPGLHILVRILLKSKYKELYEAMAGFLLEKRENVFEVLPDRPIAIEKLKKRIDEIQESQYEKYANGLHSGSIYGSEDKKFNQRIEHAMEKFSNANTFDLDIHKGVAHMNADVANSAKKLFNGDDDTHCIITTGGTESILCSLAAYKLMGKKERGINKPNIVFYDTAHAAFPKGCFFFGIEPRMVKTKDKSYTSPEPFRPYIDSNTVAIIASGCNYAHGGIDDVTAFGKMALEYGIGLHVDNCLGGFCNCFGDEIVDDMFPFDFRTPGVTTISADTHKYGYGPKGNSCCLIRPKKLFDALKYTSIDHSGVPFTMDHFGDFRSGAILAGTWAAMFSLGYSGYVEKVRKIHEETLKVRKFVDQHPDLKLYGPNNSLNMVCFDGINVNPIKVSLKLKELYDWKLSECQYPCVVHLLVSDSNVEKMDKFIKDLSEVTDLIRQEPDGYKASDYQKLYGASQQITDASIMGDLLYVVLDSCYSTTKDDLMVSFNTLH